MTRLAHDFIRVFRLAALQAGAVARYLQGKVGTEHKAGQHTAESAALTAADLAAQEVILQALWEHLPQVAIDAEEDTPTVRHFAPEDGERPLVVVDPIDGTLNYSRGSKDYAVMGALLEHARYTASLLYFPAHEELYWAIHDEGCFVERAGKPAVAVECASLPDRVLVAPRVSAEWRQLLEQHVEEVVLSRCSAVDAAAPALCRARAAVAEQKADRRRAIGFLLTSEVGGVTSFGDQLWQGEDPNSLPETARPTITAVEENLLDEIRAVLDG